MSVIEVADLAKHYGDVRAVDGISFSVDAGEIFGFLGPNGAGKTTTIRTLLGFLSPTAGTGTVLGADCDDESAMIEAKRSIGYLPANPAFEEGATGRELLDLHGSIKGESRRAELLDLFDPPLDRQIREYSSGNRQKLGIVQAFMHDPELVIMDEPTSGLDPLMQQRFNEFVREESNRGTTVFFSSHVLSEVRRVCDRVAILRDGKLVTTETIDSLLNRSGKFVRVRVVGSVPEDAFDGGDVHDLERSMVDDGSGTVPADADSDVLTDVRFTYTGDVNDLLAALSDYRLVDLDIEEAPLEEVFMRFYGAGESERPATAAAGGGVEDA
ncbi:MAG: ABC transporter ATP-binding protein [Halapricum sp.]